MIPVYACCHFARSCSVLAGAVALALIMGCTGSFSGAEGTQDSEAVRCRGAGKHCGVDAGVAGPDASVDAAGAGGSGGTAGSGGTGGQPPPPTAVTLPNPNPIASFTWQGYPWRVRSGGGGPGPNNWSINNVAFDSNNYLHLGITNQGGVWTTAEVDLGQILGYGNYEFDLASPLNWDTNIVASGFTYLDGTDELDIEYSKWAGTVGSANADYVNQGGGGTTFAIDGTIPNTRSLIHFCPNDISFKTLTHDGAVLHQWQYVGTHNPSTNQTFIFNFWLVNGMAPSNGRNAEMVITAFHYSPC